MDGETYEQIDVDAGLVASGRAFLQEGMEVEVESFEDAAIAVRVADTVAMAVTETERW